MPSSEKCPSNPAGNPGFGGAYGGGRSRHHGGGGNGGGNGRNRRRNPHDTGVNTTSVGNLSSRATGFSLDGNDILTYHSTYVLP